MTRINTPFVPRGSIVYFAYGSNMLTERLRRRTPSCRPLTVARLSGYSLRFHKKSIDGSAKCNAYHTRKASDVIVGVLYEICRTERAALDEAEFLGSGYDRREVVVGSLDSSHYVLAETYIALDNAIDESILPYDWYKTLVSSGAREHGIAEEYVTNITNHPEVVDPDNARRETHFQLTDNLPFRAKPLS